MAVANLVSKHACGQASITKAGGLTITFIPVALNFNVGQIVRLRERNIGTDVMDGSRRMTLNAQKSFIGTLVGMDCYYPCVVVGKSNFLATHLDSYLCL